MGSPAVAAADLRLGVAQPFGISQNNICSFLFRFAPSFIFLPFFFVVLVFRATSVLFCVDGLHHQGGA